MNGIVTWDGNDDVSALQGVPLQIQFKLSGANIYSLNFSQSSD
jgi:hypothetical protein